jgi:hypothetical protein
MQANVAALSKSDICVLINKLASSAARLQFVHLLVHPVAKPKKAKNQPQRRRDPDFKSEDHAHALRDLAVRTSEGKVLNQTQS